jgi:hypothetical protein
VPKASTTRASTSWASTFIADDVGEGTGQVVRWARAQGQVGLDDPESML